MEKIDVRKMYASDEKYFRLQSENLLYRPRPTPAEI